MIIDIYSYENPAIKHMRQLTKRKYRDQYKQYVIEGVRIVQDALKNSKKIEWVLFCDDVYRTSGSEKVLKQLKEEDIKLYRVPNKMFHELSDTENPQGIMAVISYEKYDIEKLFQRKKTLIIVLDRIQDPGNLGTIIRTADAAGIDAVIMSKGCVDIYNSKAIRSTMGSIFHLPIIKMGFTEDIVKILQEKDFLIVSTSLDAKQYYYEIDFTNKKCAIIIGNEANGIVPEVIAQSQHVVSIPMLGRAESLNAAVAASILIYETVRQNIFRKF